MRFSYLELFASVTYLNVRSRFSMLQSIVKYSLLLSFMSCMFQVTEGMISWLLKGLEGLYSVVQNALVLRNASLLSLKQSREYLAFCWAFERLRKLLFLCIGLRSDFETALVKAFNNMFEHQDSWPVEYTWEIFRVGWITVPLWTNTNPKFVRNNYKEIWNYKE